MLHHTGTRQLFPVVRAAVETVMPVDRVHWVAFAHVEADECGAVNQFLEVAPHAQVAHGAMGVRLSLNDMLNRPPRALADGEVLDIGGAGLRRTMLEVATPHVPHNWESHVFFEQETRTLFCGDLCTQLGDGWWRRCRRRGWLWPARRRSGLGSGPGRAARGGLPQGRGRRGRLAP